jgi:hypothetical protein
VAPNCKHVDANVGAMVRLVMETGARELHANWQPFGRTYRAESYSMEHEAPMRVHALLLPQALAELLLKLWEA